MPRTATCQLVLSCTTAIESHSAAAHTFSGDIANLRNVCDDDPRDLTSGSLYDHKGRATETLVHLSNQPSCGR